MDLSKYVELFLTEGREHVAAMTAALLVLERAVDGDGEHSARADATASIFRAVHTIKGMAAAMQYTDVADRAHVLESELDAIRTGATPLTATGVAHFYDAADALARAIETAAAGGVAASATTDGAGTAPADTPAQTVTPEPSMRREFLSRHVRVDATRLDALMDIGGELEIARLRLERISREAHDAETLEQAIAQVSRLIGAMREQVATVRMVPVAHVFERFPRLVRETARTLEKDVEFVVDGSEIELDRSTLDELGDPVLHLLRNALDHGLERPDERAAAGKPPRGRLTLSAQRETSFVVIRVADDGRGIDRTRVLDRARAVGLVGDDVTTLTDGQMLDVLTHSGFSTAEQVTDLSGRGVGLDVVDAAVRAFGGTLEMRSLERHGTVVTLRLPLSIAVMGAVLARVADQTFAIPVTNVMSTVEVVWDDVDVSARPAQTAHAAHVVHAVEGMIEIRDTRVPVVSLRKAMGFPETHRDGQRTRAKAITVDVRGRRAALVVDELVGQQDVVMKRFDAVRVPDVQGHGSARSASSKRSLFGGATILSDGAPALILDVNSLV